MISKQLLELIKNKVVRYKINIQKQCVFLYTSNKLSEREIKKAIPFINSTKINKFNKGGERPIQ